VKPFASDGEGTDHIRDTTKMVTSTFVNLRARYYIRANAATREQEATTGLYQRVPLAIDRTLNVPLKIGTATGMANGSAVFQLPTIRRASVLTNRTGTISTALSDPKSNAIDKLQHQLKCGMTTGFQVRRRAARSWLLQYPSLRLSNAGTRIVNPIVNLGIVRGQ
jgi:hypothetical protein